MIKLKHVEMMNDNYTLKKVFATPNCRFLLV